MSVIRFSGQHWAIWRSELLAGEDSAWVSSGTGTVQRGREPAGLKPTPAESHVLEEEEIRFLTTIRPNHKAGKTRSNQAKHKL